MLRTLTCFFALTLVGVFSAPSYGDVVFFDFNTPGDTQGFTASTGPANAVVTGFTAALGIDGTTGVLTSSDVEIDPQVLRPTGVTLAAGQIWDSVSIRFRQLSANPQEQGVASSTYSGNGTIIFFNNSTQNLGVGAIATKTVMGAGAFAGDTYGMTLTDQNNDNWQLMTIDLSAAPTLNSGSFTGMRFDPVGNDAAKNFEIDFVSFVSVPEPTSLGLLFGTALVGMAARRKKRLV